MKKTFLLILPALAFAAPAHAQDVSGLRVELMAAIDSLDTNLGEDTDEFNPARDRDVDLAFGVGVGFDFLNGPGVRVGVDAEFSESTANRDIIVDNSSIGTVNFGNDIYAGGRVTVPLSSRFSLVGKAGYTGLQVKANITDEDFEGEEEDFGTERLDGVRVGFGIHYAGDDDDRVYYGAEYRFSDYEGDLKRHQVALVVGARF